MTAHLCLAQTHLGAWLGLKPCAPLDSRQVGASGKSPGKLMTHSKGAVERRELRGTGCSPS